MKQGDLVHIKPSMLEGRSASWAVNFGRRTLVIESMPAKGCTNAIVKLKDDPEGGGLRIRPADLVPGPYVATAPGRVELTPFPVLLDPGTVVRWKRKPSGAEADLWVVVASASNGHRLFPLGGSSRYYRSVPASSLDVVPVSELTGSVAA